MIVVLTGAPGAGKGTQADYIRDELGYRKISTGDALRKQIKAQTEDGKVAERLMADGRLVPDDILFEILKAELGDDKSEKILLDGYPRNLAQAETLSKLADLHPVSVAVHLQVGSDELVQRLTGRMLCGKCGKSFHNVFSPPKNGECSSCGSTEFTQRPDDKEDKVRTRLSVYETETAPVLDYYKQANLYQAVKGAGSEKEVFGEISRILNVL